MSAWGHARLVRPTQILPITHSCPARRPRGPTSASTSSSWAPVFNLGFNYNFTKHWFAGVSLSYIPVSVTADLTSQTLIGPVHSQAKIRLDPIVTYAKIGYAF